MRSTSNPSRRAAPRAMIIGIALLTLAPLALQASPSVAQTCPSSQFAFGACDLATSAATLDTTCRLGFAPSHGWFDLGADTLGLDLSADFGGMTSTLTVLERFRIVGPPPGSPVGFTLKAPVTGDVNARADDITTRATGSARLELDGVLVAEAMKQATCGGYECSSTGNLNTVLSGGVSVLAGADFVVRARLVASTSGSGFISSPGSAWVRAGLRFDDLPAGAAVISCHGDTIGTVGVGEAAADARLRVTSLGPNPSRGPVRVSFTSAADGPVRVELFDVQGRVVDSDAVAARAGATHAVTLGARTSLAPAVYVVRIAQGALADARRVTVVR